MQEQEAEKAIDISGCKLRENQVFVIWKWKWYDPDSGCNSEDETRSVSYDAECENSSEETTPGHTFDDGGNMGIPYITHSVVFKCIGVTRDPKLQEILSLVSRQLKDEKEVEVQLKPEPTNPVDSCAIMFVCKLNNKWHKIGYVVREALDAVHDALDKKTILAVKFDWVKYLLHFSRSGPGWYAGIKITKNGEWPMAVVRCSSTTFYSNI